MKLGAVREYMPVVYAANGQEKERAAWEELALAENVITAAERVSPPKGVGGLGDDERWDRWGDMSNALSALRSFVGGTTETDT